MCNVYEREIIFIHDVLANKTINHFFLEDAENLPDDKEGDIDVYVPRKDLRLASSELIKAFATRGYELFRIIYNSYSTQIYLLSSDFSNMIHIDLMPEINYKGIVYLVLDKYMQEESIDWHNDVPYLGHHQFYTYKYLRDLLQRGTVNKGIVDKLFRHNPKKAAHHLNECIEQIFNVNPIDYFDSEMNVERSGGRRLKFEFYKNAIIRRNSSTVQSILSHYIQYIKRWINHPGFMICILGPDGVGKSSVINNIVKTTIFDESVTYYLLPGFLQRYRSSPNKEKTINIDPHARPRRSYVFSALKVFVWLYEYYFGYYFIVKKNLFLGRLVVFDRYYSDIIIDQKRYRYKGSTILLRWVNMLLPAPEATFILTATPEIIQSRKQEVPFHETESQIEKYLSYSAKSKSSYVINTEQSIADSTKSINAIICRAMLADSKNKYRP